MNYVEEAVGLFEEGYNCAQAVAGAYADCVDMDRKTMLKLSAPFGGGVAQLREVCGAVSGCFMVMGLLEGFTDPKNQASKKELYAKLQGMAGSFCSEQGALRCGELLEKKPEDMEQRAYCTNIVRCAAKLVEEELKAAAV